MDNLAVMSTAVADDVEALTFSTTEAARAVGVTYRQLDYWLRTGQITIADAALPGSGRHRVWTPAEIGRLADVVAAKRSAEAVLDAFAAGDLWEQAG